jgi:hypothetical protein
MRLLVQVHLRFRSASKTRIRFTHLLRAGEIKTPEQIHVDFRTQIWQENIEFHANAAGNICEFPGTFTGSDEEKGY